MSKSEADYCKKIEIWWLLKNMDRRGISFKNTTVSWGPDGCYGNISVRVNLWNDEKYVNLNYTQTDNYTGDKKDFDYRIPIIETPCHFGGVRHWFKCPLYRNGIYCGRRVGVIYKDGDWFGCRHCNNLTYSSRKLSGIAKSFGKLATLPEVEKLMKSVGRTHYRGKPTRKYRRYLRIEDQSETGFIAMTMMLGNKFNKLKSTHKSTKKI